MILSRAWRRAPVLAVLALVTVVTSGSTVLATGHSYTGRIFNAGGVAPLYPAGGVADASGNIFVSDSGGSRVAKIDTLGNITTVLGTGLSNPRALSVDSADPASLWVTDTGNNQVVEVKMSGTVEHQFFSGTSYLKSPFGNANDDTGLYIADTYHSRIVKVSKSTGSQLWAQGSCTTVMSRPRGVAVGSDGRIYAVDTDHNRVVVLDPATGTCLSSFGTTGTGNGQFKAPRALTSDGAGGLWVAEDGNLRVQHVTNSGAFLAQTTDKSLFQAPSCVFVFQSTLDVCETFKFKLLKFSITGATPVFAGSIGGTPPANGGFNQPFGVAYGPSGELYVTDMFNQRIEKFDAGGNFLLAWGFFSGSKGGMQNPRGISASADGMTVYLTNSEDNRIDLFTSTGAFVKFVKPTTGTPMFWPHQTAVAGDGTFWVADTMNSRVLHLGTTGTVLANWNAGGLLRTPRGIAMDGTYVYVANSGHNTVEKYTPAGTLVATLATPGSGPTNVNLPWNLTISGGNLYIADGNNGRVVIMTLTGTPVSTFGSSGAGMGQLSTPRSVAVSPFNGAIAVGDFGNNEISLWS